MSLMNILQFPDPRLKLVATKVTKITPQIKLLCNSMLDTMYQANGIGLAAIQVNIQQCIIVVDTSELQDQGLILINPEIIQRTGTLEQEEGCLSFPGVFAKVTRHQHIIVKYLDIHGLENIIEATELFGICIQHEIDHLNGITFFDHLSSAKKVLIKNKLAKLRKKTL
jgi:peptide deformylase